MKSKGRKKHRHVIRNLLIILLLLAAIDLALIRSESGAPPEEMPSDIAAEEDEAPFEVWFPDVGQGDCALISCGGQSMLIDGGSREQSQKVYSFLESHGIDHLAYIVASHADADHVGGLAAALNYATADNALCNVTEHDTKAFNDFLKYLDKQGISLTVPEAGSTYSLGGASFTVLFPEKGATYSDNTSLIIRVCYGETSFLFTGDTEYEDEQALIASGAELKSTVLKLGHHGSGSSSSYAFLSAVEPEYAVISVGSDNKYGHPTQKVLNRLRARGVSVFRTDMQGDIHCTSYGKTLVFDVGRNLNADTLSVISK